MDQQPKQAGYVILTLDILEDDRLTMSDKFVLARITGFDRAGGHYESVANTAKALGISERKVQYARKRLEELGYIETVGISELGTKLIKIKTLCPERGAENAPGCKKCTGVQKMPKGGAKSAPNNKEENKDNIKKDKSFLIEEPQDSADDQPQQFGNPDINALLDAWAEATGFNYKNQKMERYAMAGLLKTHGLDATKALINRVKLARRSGDRFAPQIAKPSQLRGKYSKFEALTMWAERREAEQSSTPAPMVPKNPDYFYEDTDAYDTGETREEIHERCEKLREKYGFGPRRELD